MTDSERDAVGEDRAASTASQSERTAAAAPRVPYGPPINDAIATGDLQQMKAVAEAARRSLFQVDFQSVAEDQYNEVKAALDALEGAIVRLERASGTVD